MSLVIYVFIICCMYRHSSINLYPTYARLVHFYEPSSRVDW